MKYRIKILCENTVFGIKGAIAEHGWSVLLENEKARFLIDTGQGKALLNNATVFGEDLNNLDGVILSHHHFDHTGGLLPLLQNTGKQRIFAHPDLFKESYSLIGERTLAIGNPYAKEELDKYSPDYVFNRELTEISENIFLSGEIPRKNDYEKGDARQVVKTAANSYIQDKLLDDQSIFVKTTQGIFIILGCSHSGIINILEYAIEKMADERILGVIGGTHLEPQSKDVQDKSIEALKKYNIKRLGVAHCTGLNVSARLKHEFPETFFFVSTGTELNW